KFGSDAYLVIEVAEYPRIESIEITGNDEYSKKDLEAKVNMVKGEVISDQKLKDIEYNLVKYYADEGYPLATVKADMLVSASNEARIRLKINEGKSLTVRNINNESESDISSTYLDNGYLAFNADIDEKVVSENKVDLKIKVTENNPFKFGLVNFDGNDKTKDKVLRRELYTVPGDFFTKSAVKRSLEQLRALNYFNPEKLSQDIQLANDSTVNMKYLVEERSSDQFNASVGYSGSFGITGSLGLTFNNFDISEPLSGGAGQILNFNWQFGEGGTYRTFSIGFTEPWLYNTPTSLGFNIYDTRQNYSRIILLKTSAIKMALVLAAFMILIGAGKTYSQAKVAYVDSEVILKQLPESQKIQKDMEAMQKIYLDTIGVKEANLKTMAESFKARYEDAQKKVESGQIKGEAELKALNDEIQNLQKEIQTEGEALDIYKQKIQNDLLAKQQELFKPVRDKVTKAIEDVAKDMKINFVFDKANGALIYGDKDSDITFKVLDKLK
ncbi:unnamed protein product, partial [Rotaria sp. Silwood1]